jgi:uncharacterized protein
MHRSRSPVPLLVVAALAACAIAYALDVPPLVGRVNDRANLLSAGERARLERTLADFEARTTTQIAVLTVPSLEGDEIGSFGLRVAEAWKTGQKGKDNGAILIVAAGDRKVRIEVGYGLEGALTDVESSRIIRGVIAPAFRRGDYGGGIEAAVRAMIQATQGEFTAPPGSGAARRTSIPSLLFTVLMVIVLLTSRMGGLFWPALFATSLMGRRGGRGGFGGFGGGSGGFSGGGGGFGGGGASGSW